MGNSITRVYVAAALGLTLSLSLTASTAASAADSSARVLVYKTLTRSTTPADMFQPVSSGTISAFGLRQIADYPSRTLYVGTVTSATAAVPLLRAEGYGAVLVPELDVVEFQDFSITADTGLSTPPVEVTTSPGGSRGLYLIAFQGYPKTAWLDDLAIRNVRLIEPLPPAGYLVRADRAVAETLATSTDYVRGAFPLPPGFKKIHFGRAPLNPSPYQLVSIGAVEEVPQASIRAYLESVSGQPVSSREQGNGRITYSASLSDIDMETLTHFETVYSISSVGEITPSSERQGLLALQPSFTDGRMTLPVASPDYFQLLKNVGIGDFNNTIFGILDAGFDNGQIGPAIHADFKNENGTATVISGVSDVAGGYQDDRDRHGTLVASIISGFAAFGQRHDGAAGVTGHRYTLGLAPTAPVRIDKYIGCQGEAPGDFNLVFDKFTTGSPVDVLNLSFNEGVCGYTDRSRIIDQRSFENHWLFTVSAGNNDNSEETCDSVRGPATAKNALAVGSTDNFTTSAWPNPTVLDLTCPWCTYQGAAVEDARNIPSFSAERESGSLGGITFFKSNVKPDLVAPGVRVTGPLSRTTLCTGYSSIFCHANIADYPGVATYGYSAGTSFAAPAVAGAAGVVRRWFNNIKAANPSPAMTKAILINGARDIAGAIYRDPQAAPLAVGHIPDKYQGWGMLNLTRLLGPGADYYFADEGPQLSTQHFLESKVLYIRDGTKDTRFTLAWSEPGNTNFKGWPLNDLDLIVDSGGACPCWYGNSLSTATGYSLQVPPNYANPDRGQNNVEEIIIPAYTYPSGATLRAIVMLGQDPSPQAPTQTFAVFADNASESAAPPKTYFWTVTPCRILDTRNAAGQYGGPALAAGSERTIQFTALPVVSPPCQSTIPNTARAVSLNVAVINPTATGLLRLYPTGRPRPLASAINYNAWQNRANNAVIGLGPTRAITVHADQLSGEVHAVIDITGYYQ